MDDDKRIHDISNYREPLYPRNDLIAESEESEKSYDYEVTLWIIMVLMAIIGAQFLM